MSEDEDLIIDELDDFLSSLPPREKTYQNVIALVRQHIKHYSPMVDIPCTDQDGFINIYPGTLARGNVDGLKEILEYFDEPYEGHGAHCGKGISCICGYSKFRVAKVETMAHYECKCGHKWQDDEYPGAYYSQCPSCGATND